MGCFAVAAAQAQQANKPAAEDWTVLSISHSKLRAEKPLVAQVDPLPDFTRELIEVRWRDGDPIQLYVVRPKLASKPPVILYLYSYSAETRLFLNDEFCRVLIKDGVAAVGFASALSGQRYHDRPMAQWFVSELQESLGATVHDAQMILNYLAARGDLDMSRAGMFGDGSGGAIAVLAAAADPRIKAIDLLDPWGDWPDWLAKSKVVPDDERAGLRKSEFLAKVAPLDPVCWLPRLKIPVRMEYLRSDGATPPEAIDKMRRAAPPQTVFVPREPALAEYRATKGSTFLDWIKHQLEDPRSNAR
ncbi:MAG: alpha/beta hydrolase [Acidobacteriaceae bacterium]|nr:alpha/beta hydrolase [Acidobacteriaceae bacterium]